MHTWSYHQLRASGAGEDTAERLQGTRFCAASRTRGAQRVPTDAPSKQKFPNAEVMVGQLEGIPLPPPRLPSPYPADNMTVLPPRSMRVVPAGRTTVEEWFSPVCSSASFVSCAQTVACGSFPSNIAQNRPESCGRWSRHPIGFGLFRGARVRYTQPSRSDCPLGARSVHHRRRRAAVVQPALRRAGRRVRLRATRDGAGSVWCRSPRPCASLRSGSVSAERFPKIGLPRHSKSPFPGRCCW